MIFLAIIIASSLFVAGMADATDCDEFVALVKSAKDAYWKKVVSLMRKRLTIALRSQNPDGNSLYD